MQEKLARLAKWKLHRFYSQKPIIAKYLPPTAVFSQRTLSDFLEKYSVVYIKANTQHTGKGIIKAWKVAKGYRFVIVRGKPMFALSIHDLFNEIKAQRPKQTFIIQKAIDLAHVNGRAYDIRVMMMRDGQRRWQYAGTVVKVAGQGSVVSNVNRGGGYVMTIDDALQKSLKVTKQRRELIKKELIGLSRNIILYSEKYPFFSYQCGIDLAVDKKGGIWIIEVNLHNPSHGLFNKLKDKTYFNRIRRLHSAYRKHNKRII